MNRSKWIFILAIAISSPVRADVTPARIFSDHMVIQRETLAPIWGQADSGETVTVTGSWGKSERTTTGDGGRWELKLQTPPAGGPFTLTFEGKNTVERKDILAGDVWLCSGQSNMAMQVLKCADAEKEIQKADHPQIRDFKIRIHPTMEVAQDVEADWQVCQPATVSAFSGTAYYTARELQKELEIPIGIITAAGGGTLIESWMKAKYLKDDPWAAIEMEVRDRRAKSYSEEKAIEEHKQKLLAWRVAAQKAEAANRPIPRRPGRELDPHKNKNYPGNLYRGMIAPIVPYAIRGAIWYQGESNAFMPGRAEYYSTQLKRLIENWREDWKSESLPFYFVQLPNFKAPQTDPNEEIIGWPLCRESFTQVLRSTPNTGMAVTIDIGEADDIHPKNKQDVGRRLASSILRKTYGLEMPTSPVCTASEIEDDKVVLFFDYAGSGLMAKGDKLESFAIAGADKNFVWADASIEKRDGRDVVVVCSPQVKKPVAVRYAWAWNPSRCNLYSKEGLPASPFRTDRWEFGLK